MLSGTIFEKTKIPLQKWFLDIAIILNAGKSVSSCQLSRDRHAVIDHSMQYVDGLVHTNTIEGFWSLLKRAWYGTHHHYSGAYAIAYAVEACCKYNGGKATDTFRAFLRGAVAA